MTPEQLLGRYLRELRLNRGWSLDDLSKRSGISCSSLSLIERGRKNISVKFLYKLSFVFNENATHILEKSGYHETAKIHKWRI